MSNNSTFLDRLRHPPSPSQSGQNHPAFELATERLKRGLAWFNETWQATVSSDQWGKELDRWDLQGTWADMLDRWIVLEELTRRIYNWNGCPMDPYGLGSSWGYERCDPSGPFVCQSCAQGGPEVVNAQVRDSNLALFDLSGGH